VNTPISVLLARKPAMSVQTLPPTATVTEAVKLMNQHRLGSVLVTYAGRLVGIFTGRDVLTRVLGRDREPATTPLNEVMTVHPLSVLPSDTVEQVMRVITGHLVRRLPVIDRDGTIAGLISIGDVTRWLVETHPTMNPHGAAASAAATLDRNRGRRLHGLPPQPSLNAGPAGAAVASEPANPPKPVEGSLGRPNQPKRAGGRKAKLAARITKRRKKGKPGAPRKPTGR
jgi:CBS domain-containing protein